MSAELLSMFRAMQQMISENKSAVLATVVGVSGSTYRSLGARMLILPNGQRIGSVSGGCIEGEIVKKGWWWTEGGRAYLRHYDTSLEADDSGYGLACNGSIDVLVERVFPGNIHSPLAMLEDVYRRRVNHVFATVFVAKSDGGAWILARFALDNAGNCAGEMDGDMAAAVLPYMRAAMANRVSSRMSLEVAGSSCEVVLEFVEPPLQLVVCGAGFDAVPLVRFAAQLGWRVIVCDGRADLAKA
jgi:xanthine/CO dehydrogenase XdhC/CoxF family maturation factor